MGRVIRRPFIRNDHEINVMNVGGEFERFFRRRAVYQVDLEKSAKEVFEDEVMFAIFFEVDCLLHAVSLSQSENFVLSFF